MASQSYLKSKGPKEGLKCGLRTGVWACGCACACACAGLAHCTFNQTLDSILISLASCVELHRY